VYWLVWFWQCPGVWFRGLNVVQYNPVFSNNLELGDSVLLDGLFSIWFAFSVERLV
jgi:hypothetical protein